MEVAFAAETIDPETRQIDIAERKGVGHPDTMADAVADRFSALYVEATKESFGVPLNHWVDKITLVGARSQVWFGGFDVLDPVRCLLLGKLSRGVAGSPVPIDELFRSAVNNVFLESLGDDTISRHLTFQVENTAGSGVDHSDAFYDPSDAAAAFKNSTQERVCNDTMVAVAQSRRSSLVDLAEEVEQASRQVCPEVGGDIKVMASRVERSVNLIVAVPVRPEAVETRSHYAEILSQVREAIDRVFTRHLELYSRTGTFELNTKDRLGGAYLAPFGTSLGKGDIGAVGRGNRPCGGIQHLAAWTAEAPAGKNPLTHGGHYFSGVAHLLASRLERVLSQYVEVLILARNGDLLSNPARVFVRTCRELSAEERFDAESAVKASLDR